MEDRLKRIDFTWGRTIKKLKLRREAGPLNQIFNIPEELTLHIISLLHASDVLSVGSCSKSWSKLCNSDSVWKNLYVKRWPAAERENCSSWKDSYISKEMSIASTLLEYCNKWSARERFSTCNLEETMTFLLDLQLGFEDVCHLFRRNYGVILNFIGLHYSFVCLRVSTNNLIDALAKYKVSNRQVNACWMVDDDFSCGSHTIVDYSLILSLNELVSTDQSIFYLLENRHKHVKWVYITPQSLCK